MAVARVECTTHQHCGGTVIPMSRVGTGCVLTPEHPFRRGPNNEQAGQSQTTNLDLSRAPYCYVSYGVKCIDLVIPCARSGPANLKSNIAPFF